MGNNTITTCTCIYMDFVPGIDNANTLTTAYVHVHIYMDFVA